YIPIVPIITKG
ncbi:extracellular solute-binding protein, partial [Gloeomargarita lithophora Alchichica-D10]